MLNLRCCVVLLVLSSVLREKLYCSGNGVSDISIEGGTFRGNSAEENGGAIAIWGPEVLVTITGGTFENNTAT